MPQPLLVGVKQPVPELHEGGQVLDVRAGRVGIEVLKDLAHRKNGWLEAAARALTEATEKDWSAWRAARHRES